MKCSRQEVVGDGLHHDIPLKGQNGFMMKNMLSQNLRVTVILALFKLKVF